MYISYNILIFLFLDTLFADQYRLGYSYCGEHLIIILHMKSVFSFVSKLYQRHLCWSDDFCTRMQYLDVV